MTHDDLLLSRELDGVTTDCGRRALKPAFAPRRGL